MKFPALLTLLAKDVDLAFPLVHVDANVVHGCLSPSRGVDRRVLLWGSPSHHVKREASRFWGVAGASVEDLEGDAEAGPCRDSFPFTSSNAVPSGREHDY
jgi:hypothetical protein